jgi:hypothetical protein
MMAKNWKFGEVIKYEGATLQFVRTPSDDFVRVATISGTHYLPVSLLEEVLATQFELDSLERAARYAGVTP